jgi:hypothetical protein
MPSTDFPQAAHACRQMLDCAEVFHGLSPSTSLLSYNPRKKPTRNRNLFCLEIQAPRACRLLNVTASRCARSHHSVYNRHRLCSGQCRTLASKLRHQGCILALNAAETDSSMNTAPASIAKASWQASGRPNVVGAHPERSEISFGFLCNA